MCRDYIPLIATYGGLTLVASHCRRSVTHLNILVALC